MGTEKSPLFTVLFASYSFLYWSSQWRKWLESEFGFCLLFLKLSQSLSATGHSERDLSEAAVKTGTKGFQRKMEGKGSWSFSLLCSECGASFMSRAEGGGREGVVWASSNLIKRKAYWVLHLVQKSWACFNYGLLLGSLWWVWNCWNVELFK